MKRHSLPMWSGDRGTCRCISSRWRSVTRKERIIQPLATELFRFELVLVSTTLENAFTLLIFQASLGVYVIIENSDHDVFHEFSKYMVSNHVNVGFLLIMNKDVILAKKALLVLLKYSQWNMIARWHINNVENSNVKEMTWLRKWFVARRVGTQSRSSFLCLMQRYWCIQVRSTI